MDTPESDLTRLLCSSRCLGAGDLSQQQQQQELQTPGSLWPSVQKCRHCKAELNTSHLQSTPGHAIKNVSCMLLLAHCRTSVAGVRVLAVHICSSSWVQPALTCRAHSTGTVCTLLSAAQCAFRWHPGALRGAQRRADGGAHAVAVCWPMMHVSAWVWRSWLARRSHRLVYDPGCVWVLS